MRRILAVTVLTGAICAAPTAAAGRTVSVPLTIDARGGILVAVTIGRAGPFVFVLDTGASRSIVADDLARQLGAPLVARSEVVTSAGTELRGVVRLDAVSVEGARVDGLLAPVIPAGRLAALGTTVRGVLGQDFLSAFNYTLDYRRRRLAWDAGDEACGEHGAVRLVPSEGRFVMALPQRGTDRAMRLVPDTGAEALVLFHGFAAHSTRRSPSAVTIAALTGSRATREIVVPQLVVGAVTLRDRRAVVIDREDPDADGLLPLHGFSSVSFAAGGACVVIRQ